MRIYTCVPVSQATSRTQRSAICTPAYMRKSLDGTLAILKFESEDRIDRTDINKRDASYRKLTLEEAQALVRTAAWERTPS